MKLSFDWYPVFLREMLLFKHKLLRVGYLFSAMVAPIIYLVTFGLGLGRHISMQNGSYIAFLLPGLVAMTSMNNSYTWVASALNLNRLYFKTFQVLVQAPLSSASILIGEILAGMTKGLFASVLILAVGFVADRTFAITPIFVGALLLNCFLFACMGVIVGMKAKSHEDTSTYSNFFIMPMAFLSGTFFRVDMMPPFLKAVIYVLPLTHTNILIRKSSMDPVAWMSLMVLLIYSAGCFAYGAWLIRNYSE
jgi:ABC-type multidrug transport system permease subunit